MCVCICVVVSACLYVCMQKLIWLTVFSTLFYSLLLHMLSVCVEAGNLWLVVCVWGCSCAHLRMTSVNTRAWPRLSVCGDHNVMWSMKPEVTAGHTYCSTHWPIYSAHYQPHCIQTTQKYVTAFINRNKWQNCWKLNYCWWFINSVGINQETKCVFFRVVFLTCLLIAVCHSDRRPRPAHCHAAV